MFYSSTKGERQVDLCEMEESLVYILRPCMEKKLFVKERANYSLPLRDVLMLQPRLAQKSLSSQGWPPTCGAFPIAGMKI